MQMHSTHLHVHVAGASFFNCLQMFTASALCSTRAQHHVACSQAAATTQLILRNILTEATNYTIDCIKKSRHNHVQPSSIDSCSLTHTVSLRKLLATNEIRKSRSAPLYHTSSTMCSACVSDTIAVLVQAVSCYYSVHQCACDQLVLCMQARAIQRCQCYQ
jgi:hypothetical protein